MTRDYKPRTTRRAGRKSLPPWLWALLGLAVGLGSALFAYKHSGNAPSAPRAAHLDLPDEQADEGAGPAAASKAVPRATPKPAPPPKPRFDFYTILPKMEVVVPEESIKGKSKGGVVQVEQPGTYYLQAGSFRALDQADHLKAQLALLGLHAGIETVTVNKNEAWHRVRVGPYKNLDELNRARALLKENNMTAVLVKLK
ncbi:MAG: SPOR domain-containing protein [Gammaproteobacteria bacterium]